jgi:hypothetical protein
MALFTTSKQGLLNGEINWLTGTIKVSMIKNYTLNTSHSTMDQIVSSGATIATTFTLTNKSITTAGYYTADNLSSGTSPDDPAATTFSCTKRQLPAVEQT